MKNEEAPIRYTHVSQTQLSVARYYGRIKVNGIMYIYDAATDTLTREDIVKSQLKSEKEEMAKAKKEIKNKQINIF